MKLISFHLMPYRPLDFDEAAKHRSTWVVLPNSLYDPVKGADEYAAYIDFLADCEKLGFDGIGVNEHHQNAYGLMPAPNLIASALIQRTKTIKIAILGRALPIVSNPIFIAEEYAMLDNLSRGRIICGFVRGIGAEYHSTGVNPYFSHERFHEAHDLIIKAWTQPGPFSFDGQHFNLRYVNLWPRPYQTPHPPIWIPSQGSSETVVWAAHPSRKYPFLVTFSSTDLVVRYLNTYRDQARKYGYEPESGQFGWACPLYVAETDERAKEEAGLHLAKLDEEFLQDAHRHRRRQVSERGSSHQQRHRGNREPEDRTREDRRNARQNRPWHPLADVPIRHSAGSTRTPQHRDVRRRSDAAFARIGRSRSFCFVRACETFGA